MRQYDLILKYFWLFLGLKEEDKINLTMKTVGSHRATSNLISLDRAKGVGSFYEMMIIRFVGGVHS
jgi:hypothetical protein